MLTLSKEDQARSQSHLNSLRAARLRAEQDQVRQDWFRNEVLAAPDTARVWWLLTHTDSAPKPQWEEFREHILPLVSAGDDAQARADRFVRGVARLWDELGDDPGRHARFAEVVNQVLTRMGWPNDESWWTPPAPEPEPETRAGPEAEPRAAHRGRSGRRGDTA
ncbi:hypothetical protein [Kitasatospora cineracea]|uniref:hypothetical protein n=1 Tax=Kitasatospora cineracea TaxID=88074 RepID=UPI0033E36490